MYRSPSNAPPLVVTAFGGFVVALRTEDGLEEWRQRLGGATVRIDVTTERVVAAAGGKIVVLDYATGEIQRTIPVAGEVSTLLVVGSRVLVSQSGVMVCVDLEEGRELWRNELPGTGYGAAAIGVPGRTVQADRDS